MKYFKSMSGEVFAYENEDERQKWGARDLVEMTQSEIDAHLNPPPLPVDELLALAKDDLRSLRRDMLDAVTGIGFRANVAGNTALAQEAATVSQQLLDITDDPALNAAQTYEEMRSAGLTAYRRIADAVSPELRSAFKELDK